MTRDRRKRWLDRVPRRKREQPAAQQQPAETTPDASVVPVVPYVPVRCPSCRSHRKDTIGAPGAPGPGRKRYHICQSCSMQYHSVELDPFEF